MTSSSTSSPPPPPPPPTPPPPSSSSRKRKGAPPKKLDATQRDKLNWDKEEEEPINLNDYNHILLIDSEEEEKDISPKRRKSNEVTKAPSYHIPFNSKDYYGEEGFIITKKNEEGLVFILEETVVCEKYEENYYKDISTGLNLLLFLSFFLYHL